MGFDGTLPAVDPEDLPTTGRGLDQPEQQSDCGRLARPVGTEIPHHLALVDLEIEVAEGGQAPYRLVRPSVQIALFVTSPTSRHSES